MENLIKIYENDFKETEKQVSKVLDKIKKEFLPLAPMLDLEIKPFPSEWRDNIHKKEFKNCVLLEGGFNKYWGTATKSYSYIDEIFKKVALIDGKLCRVNVMSGTSVLPFEEDLKNTLELIIKRNKDIFKNEPDYKWSEEQDPQGKIRKFILNYEN